ncbi:DNA polymerase III alpha subunit [Catovirus CTV1]|mgnify:CR=1 FL=1|uniref:DNA polymerase III alpha subunit n=1 Tax=Catovirus CTV1 TaxID=1977631 RepID=A0A1V0S985_9VIRU|nr:DNA polymerase III alpha subunit [Catovirus CTV1]
MNKLLSDSIFSHNDSIEIEKNFKRKCPKEKIYVKRMKEELELIISKNLARHVLRVCEILNLLENVPHIIRGSYGSSLICYLLGITNIDPIKENISFSRFLNIYKTKLPDFDIDIPHIKHDLAFRKISKKWGNKVARISNHVTYGEKEATRKAIKEMGFNKIVPKTKCNSNFFKDEDKKKELIKKIASIKNTFKCYSLHCGGIIFFDQDIPKELIVNNKNKDIQQIKYNKDDVDKKGIFKIDILSNRGLTQLFDISNMPIENYPNGDHKVVELLCSGKNIGLTFGESPLVKKLLCFTKPKNINDLAKCLAIIRPMASGDNINNKKIKKTDVTDEIDFDNLLSSSIIFDDDAIQYIQKIIGCTEEIADKYRRSFGKSDWKEINKFCWILKNKKNISSQDCDKIKQKLLNLRKYSFCKSHAFSYAKLVWALAYQKVYNPALFWLSTLNNCDSMYRSWVYFREAKNVGLILTLGKKPWVLNNNTLISSSSIEYDGKLSMRDQIKQYGYWINDNFLDGCSVNVTNANISKVKFVGLIATGRITRKYKDNKCTYHTYITIGYANCRYIDIIIDSFVFFWNYDIIKGEGIFKELDKESRYGVIHTNIHKLEKLN